MNSKKYKSSTSKFFDETDELEVENNSEVETIEVEEAIDETIVHQAISEVEEDVTEFEEVEEEIEEEEYEDEFEYFEEEYEDEYEDEYEEDEEPKKRGAFFKSKKAKYGALGTAVGIILLAVVLIIVTVGRVEYVENVEIYVDGVQAKVYNRVEEGTLQDKLIEDGYDEENYKEDDAYKSTATKIYLVSKKEITVTYHENEWDKETFDVFGYKLNTVLMELEIEVDDSLIIYVDEAKIDSTKYDDTVIRFSSNIRIIKNTVEEEIVEEAIPYSTIETLDPTLPVGERKVSVVGKNGLKRITYNVYYSNGEEVSREIINSEIVTGAVNEVILIGTMEEEVDPGDGGETDGGDATGT